MKAVVFDLDDTLIDTSLLRVYRDSRRWKDAVREVGRTTLFDGVRETIQALDNRHIPWAVVTTSVSFYANAVLSHHNLKAKVLVAYHDATPKPSPAPIHLALQRLGIEPDDVVGIGDNAADLNSYRAAGLVAVGAGWSPMITPLDWDAVLSSPRDLLVLQ